jgi:competence protein ComEC
MDKVYHTSVSMKFVGILVMLFISNLSLALYLFFSLHTTVSNNQNLKVHFLDIGQGDAIYIETPNRNSMLIDSGPQNEKVISEIQNIKNIFDRRVDILIATHADSDHIGSMKKVMQEFAYKIFAYSGLKSKTQIFEDLMSELGKTNSKIYLTAGMSIVLDSEKDIRFDVLFPDFEFQISEYSICKNNENKKITSEKITSNMNASKIAPPKKTQIRNLDKCLKKLNTETNLNSVVGILSFGEISFMLTGDAPIEVEKFIVKKYSNVNIAYSNNQNINKNKDENIIQNMKRHIDLQSDILKLGHHGSKTSTSMEFLEALKPSYAIVSSGKNNRYGHPNKSVLDNINFNSRKIENNSSSSKNISTQILRTDTEGTISFYSNGIKVWR